MCLESENEGHRLPKDYEEELVMASAITMRVSLALG